MILKGMQQIADEDSLEAFQDELELNLDNEFRVKKGLNVFRNQPDPLFVISCDKLYVDSSNSDGSCWKK